MSLSSLAEGASITGLDEKKMKGIEDNTINDVIRANTEKETPKRRK
ncbi:MAG: hypothetical protein ACRDD7_03895 [Peptostreptococcaceae bacterium]